MQTSGWRRLGAILLIVVVLGVAIVPAAAAAPAPTGEAAPVAETVQVARSGGTCGVWYVVKRGDTLTIIARRYGTTVWNLMRWNGISNPNRVYAGQALLVRPCTTPPPPPPPPPGTWHAQYFNTPDLTGGVVVDRRDANINFNWGWGSPAPAVFPDKFSVRWTRTFNMAAGTYRLTARVDDGIRVWIDDTLVLDEWRVQAVTTFTQDYILTASGNRTFRVEYYEEAGVAEVYLTSQKLY